MRFYLLYFEKIELTDKGELFMFKSFVLASAVFLAPATVMAQTPVAISELPAGAYVLDKTHASLTWRVMHMGLAKYTARFTDFDAELELNPADVTQSKLMVKIDPTSIRTDYPYPEKKDFDAKLVNDENWFNAKAHPEMTYTATELTKLTETTGKMTGDLTFLGITKPVTLDVTFNGAMAEHPFTKKAAVGFSAHGTLNRSEWGMSHYIPMIGDEVELLIEVEFGQKG